MIPHVYSVIWIVDVPQVIKGNGKKYNRFVGNVIPGVLPHETEKREMDILVTTYKLHISCKTCLKYKNQSCQFQSISENKYLVR